MSNHQGLRYYNNDYNRIEECPYYPLPSQNRQIIEDYPSDRAHKRDKKWSFSNLFRRKKKDNISGSSSEEEQKKSGGFLQRKRKPDNRKKSKNVGTFDHVVLPPSQRILSPKPVIYPDHIVNDSSQKNSADSFESLHSGKRCLSRSSCASTSLDSFGRKSRREQVKARVEARRDCLKTESSSEEDSQKSVSSSVTKFRSDDSLGRSRDNSATRKSRSARTERYIHRRSSKESLNGGSSCNGLPPPEVNSHYYYSPPPLINPTVKPEPPPPPPRDPQRRLIIGQVGENGRPVSYSFETEQQENIPLRKNCGSTTSIQSYNSDFGIGRTSIYCPQQNQRESTPFRSNSVNSEPIRRYIKRHPRLPPETNTNCPDRYNYFADHLPRSRKPIIIQASNLPENKYLSDSQIVTRNSHLHNNLINKYSTKIAPNPITKAPSSSIETFKVQVPKEEAVLVTTVAVKNNRIYPPKPRISHPKVLMYSKSEERESPPAPISTERRTSSNLEDALNELEAIYNSLRLGDEDLLDRAEQQEIQSRLQSKTADNVKICGSMSDSGYDFDYQDRNRFKRSFLKSSLKKSDDMAERKLQQQQQIPAVAELEKGLTQISYLLASPVHNSIDSFCANPKPDEPDVTLDDVVFRNIKHINNTLKVVEPQPPFGIPLGPISAAANSDYLHAIPNEKQRNTFKPNKIPDVVKDDLAYRTLRKDGIKDTGLPALTADDYINNNKNLPFSAKKKRAVRSLSANIYNLLYNTETMEKAKSITDIKDETDKLSSATSKNDGKSELHQKLQVYIPLYDNVIVNSKPPSGLSKSSSKRATPSPVPRQTDASEATSSPETVQKQEGIITVVAEHAKLCEKLLECVIESTELISHNKAVTEFVPDDEHLLALEAIVPPTVATVTESAESQMATLEVEPITVEMLSESDDHDYENLHASVSEEDILKGDTVDSSESTTITPVDPEEPSVIEDCIEGEPFVLGACPSSPSAAKAQVAQAISSEKSSIRVSRDAMEISKASPNDYPSLPQRPSCAMHRDPAPFFSVCYQSACDLFQNIDIVALLGLLLAIVSVIVCFVK